MVSVRDPKAFSLVCVRRAYVTNDLPADILAPLHEQFLVDVWRGDGPVPRAELLEVVTDIDGLLCMVNDEIDIQLLDNASRLSVVSQMAVGVDNIDVDECAERGIAVGHTPGVLTETVADTAFALLGSVVRRLPEGADIVKRGEWGPWDPFFMTGQDLHGTTMGIVGMGRIGQAVARRSTGFDMKVIYANPRPEHGVDGEHTDLDDLLAVADHVVLCVSLRPDTVGLIGRRELSLMRKTAFLVNVARGRVVHTDALLDALASGSIAGAALDVTDPEPLPMGHPLLSFPNCLVVPHVGSASVATRRAMASLAVENLIAGLEGLPLPAGVPTRL
jgi:lactate dehydrogenase-like 2-hydroxyacid dehydrogenase